MRRRKRTDLTTMMHGLLTVMYKASFMVLMRFIKRSCKKYGIQVHFKAGLTIENLLMAPKDKDHILKSGVIYRYKCDKVECCVRLLQYLIPFPICLGLYVL